MIDPSFDTVVPVSDMSVYALQDARIKELEKQLDERHLAAAQIARFEEALKYNEWDFDGDTLQSLADFFGITLEREYEVTVTVRFSGTVTVPYDYDIDDLENDLSAEITTHHYGNSSVDVDFSEEGMEIDYQEV